MGKISPCAVFTTNESLLPVAKTARSRSGCGATHSGEPLTVRPLASRTATHAISSPLSLSTSFNLFCSPSSISTALPAQLMLQRRGLLDGLQQPFTVC